MRTAIIPFLHLLLAVGPLSASPFTYTAVAPLRITPNAKFVVTTTLHTTPADPVKFSFVLQDVKNVSVASTDATLSKEGKEDVELNVGALQDENYNFTVTATSGSVVHTEQILVQRETKERAVLIQTDKPVYKPGETVKFRIFLLSKFFQPLSTDKSVTVTVYDPQRNVIKSWPKVAPLNVTSGRGFGSEEFQLSPEPNLGQWSVEAVDTDGEAERSTLNFDVDQYVLPKFVVSLTSTPSFVTYNDSQLTIRISALYTHGKPVPATCTVILKEPYTYYLREGRVASVSKTAVTQEGVANLEFDVKKELKLNADEVNKWGKTFSFFASCQDIASGHVRNETLSVTMYQLSYKVELVERPSAIRPGFPLNITLKVTTHDDVPVGDSSPDALKVEHGFDYSAEGGVLRTSVPPNGIVVLEFVAPTNPKVCYEAIDVTFKEAKESFWLPSKRTSSTASYMQLQLLTPASEVHEGEPVRFNVKTSRPTRHLNALTLSRGSVRRSELVEMVNKPNKIVAMDSDISIILPPQSSPRAHVLFYTTFDNGDLIADSIQLDVLPDKSNEVVVSVAPSTQEPGNNVSISVKGRKWPGKTSVFGLRAVDQSVLLLKKDNDLSQDKLAQVANNFRSRGNYWGGSEIFQQFVDNGLGIFTNTKLDKGQLQSPLPPALPMFSKISAEMAYDTQSEEEKLDFQGAPVPQRLPVRLSGSSAAFAAGSSGGGAPPPPRIRTNFPETWIWEDVESSDGEITLHKTVPDTITSWFVSAFQVDKMTGLSLGTSPAKVTVFRPFFIVLNLPYSVIKGEILVLQVLIHNYLDKPVTAAVTLDNADGFFKFVDAENEISSNDGKPATEMTKNVHVNASSISTLTFPISPLKHGIMTLKAKATTPEAGDALVRTLIVKPPGIRHVQNSAVLVNLLTSPTFSAKGLSAVFPDNRVPDADSLKVSVIGDILGGTLHNLDKLIQLPRGCGEQNMVNFVPNIVVLDYLNVTGGLTDDIRRKTTQFLERGYQQQLTYFRNDGSFSAFGKSDSTGSTWLTAFVTRAFIQARKYITVDEEVINRSLRFLIRQQNDNGSFAEDGFVYDKSLQGGVGGQGQVALTAFTLLAFVEADAGGLKPNASVLEQGLAFIFNQTLNKDPYTANLVSYLLHRANHPRKDDYYKISKDLVRHENDTIHWEQISKQRPSSNITTSFKPMWREINRIKPATVEITSYGLLTYVMRRELDDAVSISKWLLRHRNAEGGFFSTQDTIVGITSLAEFAQAISIGEGAVEVKVSWADGSHDFQVAPSNRIVVQEFILPPNVHLVDLSGTGKGTALAQLTWSYYVEQTDAEPAFELTTDVKEKDKGRTLTMKICAAYTRGDRSNMAIVEANTPSGYAFDEEELISLRNNEGVFKRYELENKDSHVNLYFEGLEAQSKCVSLLAYRIYLVAKHAPGEVSVYDYYDNTQKAQVLYPVPPVSLCDICATEPSCKIAECA